MRGLKLLVLCLSAGLMGCGGGDNAQPPPGVDSDTSALEIEYDPDRYASDLEEPEGGEPREPGATEGAAGESPGESRPADSGPPEDSAGDP